MGRQRRKGKGQEDEDRLKRYRILVILLSGLALWCFLSALLFLLWREKQDFGNNPSDTQIDAGQMQADETEMTESETQPPSGSYEDGENPSSMDGAEELPGQESPYDSQESEEQGTMAETPEPHAFTVPLIVDGKKQDTGLLVLSEEEKNMVSLWDVMARLGYDVRVTKDQAYCSHAAGGQGIYNHVVVDYDGTITFMEKDTGEMGSETSKLSSMPVILGGDMFLSVKELEQLIPNQVKKVSIHSDGAIELRSPDYVKKLEAEERRRREEERRRQEEAQRQAEEQRRQEEAQRQAEEQRRQEESQGQAEGQQSEETQAQAGEGEETSPQASSDTLAEQEG